MAYTTINKSTDYFNTKLYTGNGSTNAITGVGFQPDMCWWKMRSGIEDHALGDAVRGAEYIVKPNSNGAQAQSASYFSSFDSDGFTLGSDTKTNGNGSTYASWNWKANGQGSSNTDGSITSTVSVDTTSKCSIVKFTSSGSGGTVGHGLGVAPKVIIFKRLDAASDWAVYQESMGNVNMMFLNTTTAPSSNPSILNSTSPTSTLFTVGSSNIVTGGPVIAYCFSEVQGYSAFGQYRGNAVATDGTFVNCGFRPSLVIQKRLDGAEPWFIFDDKRQGYNPENEYLLSNSTDAEGTSNRVDLLSNGFKLMTTDGGNNANGGPYIYMAWGHTLVGSNNVPANAR